jgi:copper chaperone NosL
MTIVDPRFGAEIVTDKGKIYKFDAVECMVNFLYRDNNLEEREIGNLYVIDFSDPGQLVLAEQNAYLHSKQVPSPMGMYLSAHGKTEHANNMLREFGGNVLTWQETMKLVLDTN